MNEPTHADQPAERREGAPDATGPAGWPGATHFGAGLGEERRGGEPAPAPRVEEVEAERISRSQVRGPAIDVGAAARSSASSETGAPPPPPNPAPPPPPSAPPPQPPVGSSAAAGAAPGEGRLGAVLAHLAYLIPGHVPGLIVTVLIWAFRRRANPFLDDQAREALNFQLCYAIVNLLLAATCCCLGWLTFPVWLVGAVLCAVAAVEAGDGKRHRYPWIFRLIT